MRSAQKDTNCEFLRYQITLPDGRVRPATLDPRASGHDCLWMVRSNLLQLISKQVCNSLGVFDEADYFGLTYPGGCGEELWVNSRNQLAKQVPKDSRQQLRLAVRFFVQPHMLVMEETRCLFYLEAKRRFRVKTSDEEDTESGNLEQVSSLPEYGLHYYPAWDCYRARRCIGVGPQAVYICREDRSVIERYAFPRVQKVTRSGRLVYLSLSNQEGRTNEVGFRLASDKAATGLYRCITETHSFFRCDTVRSGVSEQKCRDFKAALVLLIFTEADACIVPKFAFDVRRTAREVHDCARRRQLRHRRAAAGDDSDARMPASTAAASSDDKATVAALTLRLESLLQEQTCRLCADRPVSVVFVPCGHVMACAGCSEKLSECPLCRQTVARRQPCLVP